VAIDMGGTSFDVSVVYAGRTTMISQGNIDGCPVRLPMIDIRTIGAGGGSIAWVDDTGRMRVGPRSAGSEPGPVCYGRGGTQPAVTDANVVLGRIDPDLFLGGKMKLDREGARKAIAETLSKPLGLGVEEAAAGMLEIATSHMAGAIRLSLFERGLDPEDFAAISFGGAGGLHAIEVAAEAGIGRVVFPRGASTLSAWGMLWSDVVHDMARTVMVPATGASIAALSACAADLASDGAALLDGDRVPATARSLTIAFDMRYEGQGFELTIPIEGTTIDVEVVKRAVAAFHHEHQQRFSHSNTQEPVEVVTLRASARGHLPKPQQQAFTPQGEQKPRGSRPITIDGALAEVPVYDRAVLRPARRIVGPVMIEEPYTSLYIPPGWSIEAAETGDLVATEIL
jgi:N-methylhydantoinase A